MAYEKTAFLLNLNPDDVVEPPVTNADFLDSLATVGVWLRVMSAFAALEDYNSPAASTVGRMAHLTNIYLQQGAQLEDHAVALAALSAWSKNRDLSLADLFSRVFLVRSSKTMPAEEHFREVSTQLLEQKGRVRVSQHEFFSHVTTLDDVALIDLFLGYKWRRTPSVKLIPREHLAVWRSLPQDLRRICGSLADPSQGTRMASAFNKLKHGPQIVVQNPAQRVRDFAKSEDLSDQLKALSQFNKPSIRLLFAGSRTQSKTVGAGKDHPAPFLIDDRRRVEKLFFGTMVHEASTFYILFRMHEALYKRQKISLDVMDHEIQMIIEKHGYRLGAR